MLKTMGMAAIAVMAATGVASAVTVGQLSAGGIYVIQGGGTFDLGDTLNIGGNFGTGSGAYAGITNVTPFALITSAANTANNVGTSFGFGPFTFTVDSTEYAALNSIGLTVFGFGTVTGGAISPAASSYRLTVAGAAQDNDDEGTFSLFIQTPPEDFVPPQVPLPASLPLLVTGLLVFGALRRKA